MKRAISNRNVCDATFKVADFQGQWLASIGKPELRGAWTIFGESGSGKTHFALSLLKYLTGFVKRCAYNTLEQGLSKSFQTAWNDADMQSVGTKVIVYDKLPIEEMKEHLRRRKSPDVIVIDSISALVGFTRPAFAKLIEFYKTDMTNDDADVVEFMKSHGTSEILGNEKLWGVDLSYLTPEVEKYVNK